jgi:hypothetical protein
MAVVTLGGIGITQRYDLAVVSRFVGLQLFFVAIAALRGHSQLERVTGTASDPMGAMAV